MKTSIIQNAFRELFGQPCWGIDYSKTLNLWINFGEPYLSVCEPYQTKRKTKLALDMASRRVVHPRGRWRLWVYCSYWRLSRNGDLLAFFSSSYRRIQQAINKLNGEKLVSVQINPKSPAPISTSMEAARLTKLWAAVMSQWRSLNNKSFTGKCLSLPTF
jgi:hypothetical protein